MTIDNKRYAEMAARFEADESPVRPGATVQRGAEAREEARTILLEAADTETEREHIRNLGGRPALDPDADGPSPLWAIRAPQSLDTAMRTLAQKQGRSFSAVLRDAAQDYLAAHQAV